MIQTLLHTLPLFFLGCAIPGAPFLLCAALAEATLRFCMPRHRVDGVSAAVPRASAQRGCREG